MIDTALASHTSVTELMELTLDQLDDIREALYRVLERRKRR